VTIKTERRSTARLGKDSRHRARETALQMLYQWEIGRTSVSEVLRTFWLHQEDTDDPGLSEELRRFAVRLVTGVTETVGGIDPVIVESAEHWRLERMNVMDRLILRLAIYEFLYEPGTPGRVVINEALELARTFSGDDSVRFINGILDAIRRRLGRE
jgi:N utilization substance protein B